MATMGWLRTEWRRFRRVIPESSGSVTVSVETPAGVGKATVRDLSEGGLELQTAADPAWLDRPMRLHLALPGGIELALRGRVRHVDSDRVGVVFEDIGSSEREHIRAYITDRASQTWWRRLRRLL